MVFEELDEALSHRSGSAQNTHAKFSYGFFCRFFRLTCCGCHHLFYLRCYLPRATTCLWRTLMARANACSRSSIKSLTSSIPTDSRTRSGAGASLPRNDLGILACDMRHGSEITEPTEPKLTAISNSRVASTMRCDNCASPVVKLMTAPAPFACRRFSS